MGNIERLQRKRRKFAVGQMRQRIVVQNRGINPTEPGQTEFTENFTQGEEIWAAVETKEPKEYFDGVNLVKGTTHRFYIRYRADITPEWFLFWENNIYDIMKVEDLEERHEYLTLFCNLRGNKATPVNVA